MLNDEICNLRDKLNESILNKNDYSIIYNLSIELDVLIAKHYQDEIINTTIEMNKERNLIRI